MIKSSRWCRRCTGIAVAVLFWMWGAVAWTATPEEVVEQGTKEVAAVLAQPDGPQRAAALADAVEQNMDFQFLAARALGEHWKERTEEERDLFMTLLRRLLQANYEDEIAGRKLDDDYTMEFDEAQKRDDRAFVAATVTIDDRVESIVYRLHRQEGAWEIYDVIVDDISLEETYRDGYVPILEEDGWEELIRRMEERAEELEASSSG